MPAIAPLETVSVPAVAVSHSGVSDGEASFLDLLTAAGPCLPGAHESTDSGNTQASSMAASATDCPQDLVPQAPGSNTPNPKNKNTPNATAVHPFLPGTFAPTILPALTTPDLAASTSHISTIDSTLHADPATAPDGDESPNAPSISSSAFPAVRTMSVSPASEPANPDVPLTTSPAQVSPTHIPDRVDSGGNATSSGRSPASPDSVLAATSTTQNKENGSDIIPAQRFVPPSSPACEPPLATSALVSEPASAILEADRSSWDSSAGTSPIAASAMTEPLPVAEPANESAQFRDFKILAPSADSSTEQASPSQQGASSSPRISAAPVRIFSKRSAVRVVAGRELFVKTQPRDLEEKTPAAGVATDACRPGAGSIHSENLQPAQPSNSGDYGSHAALTPAVTADSPFQISSAEAQPPRGITPTTQHIAVPPGVSDSLSDASLQSDDPRHNTNSSDHKAAVPPVPPLIAAPALIANAGPSHEAVNLQPQSPVPANPHAQGSSPGDSPLRARSLSDLPTGAAPSSVHLAQIVSKAAQSEMRIGLTTPAFGTVQLRTVVHANDVAVQIGSERGDLKTLLTTEVPGISHTLQQHDLRLTQIHFEPQGFAFSHNTSQHRDAQPRSFASKSIPDPPPERTPLEASTMPELEIRKSRGLSILA